MVKGIRDMTFDEGPSQDRLEHIAQAAAAFRNAAARVMRTIEAWPLATAGLDQGE